MDLEITPIQAAQTAPLGPFGGSSLCDAARCQNVASILNADPARRYVVPSAPGKRYDGDEKVTDLLYQCHRLSSGGKDFAKPFSQVEERYREIAEALSLSDAYREELQAIREKLPKETTPDYAASRGEYLCGIMLAEYLGWEFLDAAEVICFDADGKLDRGHKMLAAKS